MWRDDTVFLAFWQDPMIFSYLFTDPLLFVVLVAGIVFALTVHEFSHALVAHTLGDPTADRAGRLSLNPLKHLDPTGFILLLLAGFGYAKPVPYNPAYLKDRRTGPVLIGLAGPLSNVVFATVSALLLKFFLPTLGASNLLIQFLFLLALININLAVFNLIPVPPLDGSKLLHALLSGPQWDRLRYTLETQGPFILLALILLDQFSGFGFFSHLLTFFGGAFFRLFGLDFGL
jgi:Zn-dependent protease